MEDENRHYCVYVHTNKINGKKYFGVTGRKPEKRWQNGRGYNKNEHFSRAIKKYGWNNFDHEVLCSCLTKEEADKLEEKLINEFDTTDQNKGYNLRCGGGSRGKASEETKKKMSKAQKGKRHSEETKRKISKVKTGQIVTKETREKISKSLKGKMYGGKNPSAKKTDQYALNGEFIKTWDCAKDAARALNISPSHISECCNDNFKTYGGYLWRWHDEKLTKEHIKWCNTNESFHGDKITQYDMNGNLIKIWDYLQCISDELGFNKSAISAAYSENNTKSKTAYGFIWKRADKPLTKEEIEQCNHKQPDKNKRSRRSVAQYSKNNNELIKVWDSVIDASNATGILKSNIYQCCLGEKKSAGGYVWKYYDDVKNELENE